MTEPAAEAPQQPAGGRKQKPPPTPQERVDQLRSQLAEAEAELPRDPDTTLVSVEPPITTFSYGGIVVDTFPRAVPNSRMTALTRAAMEAGVALKTEG
jgi:hypothetical protein